MKKFITLSKYNDVKNDYLINIDSINLIESDTDGYCWVYTTERLIRVYGDFETITAKIRGENE